MADETASAAWLGPSGQVVVAYSSWTKSKILEFVGVSDKPFKEFEIDGKVDDLDCYGEQLGSVESIAVALNDGRVSILELEAPNPAWQEVGKHGKTAAAVRFAHRTVLVSGGRTDTDGKKGELVFWNLGKVAR